MTSPTREAGKKAQAAPGVEMSLAELTQGAAAKHFPSLRKAFQMVSPPLPQAGISLLYITVVLEIIKKKEPETLQRGTWNSQKMRIRIQTIGDKLDKQEKKKKKVRGNSIKTTAE